MSRTAVVLGALLAAALAAPAWAGDGEAAAQDGPPAATEQGQQAQDEPADEEKEAPALKATFLGEGTWATEADCRNLRKLEAGASYPDVEPARLFTIDGSKYIDQSCTFASLDPQPGGIVKAGMACRGGCDSFTENVLFTPLPKGGYALSYPTDPQQRPLIRCEPKPKPVETN